MTKRRTGLVTAGAALLAITLAPPGASQTADSDPQRDIERALAVPSRGLLRAHTRFLSHDLLEGRAPGTRGAQLAAAYIAAQFEAAGLSGAALDGQYLQRFPLMGVRAEPSMVIGVGRRIIDLEFPDEYVARPMWAEPTVAADAEIVFVGYGISAPEWEWDDFGDAPLTGKILVILANDPGLTDWSRFGGRKLSYYGTSSYKLEQAARLGASGVLFVHTEESAGMPWHTIQNGWLREQLLSPERPTETLRFAAWLTESATRRVTEAAGKNFESMVRQAQSREFRPIPLGAHAVVFFRNTLRATEGINVMAKLEGRHPVEPEESVVLMAHYDHLGVGPPVLGDSIYNGAIDNASGVAALLGAAAGLAKLGGADRRSLIFLATTAGESGFLGARAFLTGGPLALERTAAVINIDRPNVTGPKRGTVGLGSDLSNLSVYLDSAARMEGLFVQDDPQPERGLFFQSDHLPFAQAGVPVLYLMSALASPDSTTEATPTLEPVVFRERYHQPDDELDSALSFDGVLQDARLMIRLGLLLGNTERFPAWLSSVRYRPQGERLRLRRVRGKP